MYIAHYEDLRSMGREEQTTDLTLHDTWMGAIRQLDRWQTQQPCCKVYITVAELNVATDVGATVPEACTITQNSP